MRQVVIYLILFFVTGGYLFSQTPSINYTKENGLASNTIYCSLQDRNGFVWFGTDKGITRFDGFEFKTFTTEDGLTDNEVFRMFQDSRGRIWFLTHNGKLCFYFDGVIYNGNNVNYLNELNISSFFTHVIEVNSNELLFFKENSNHLYSFSNFKFRSISNSAIHSFCSISQANGNVYVLGIHLNNKDQKEYKLFSYTGKLNELNSILTNNVFASHIFVDNKHVLADRGEPGVGKLSLKLGESFDKLKGLTLDPIDKNSSSFPVTMYERNKIIYIPTSTGTYVVNMNTLGTEKLLDNESCTSVFHDFENGLWITSKNNGVFYFPATNCKKVDGLGSNLYHIVRTPEKDSKFYITSIGKYYTYDIKSKEIKETFIDSHIWNQEIISDVVFFDKNNYLISSSAGLIQVDDDKQLFAQPRWKAGIKKIEIVGDTIYYARSNSIMKQHKKLLHANSNVDIQKSEFILDKRAFYVAKDLKNQVWIGAVDGIYKYDNKIVSKKFTQITTRINNIKFSSTEEIMAFSSELDGLYIYLKDSLLHLSIKNGLISNQVNCIYFDTHNDLWVGTTKGISKVEINNNFNIQNISLPNGLADSYINDVLELDDSTLMLTCPSGLYTYNYKQKVSSPKPKLNVLQIKVNSLLVTKEHLLNLECNENNIEVSFIGISFASKKNIQYMYSFEEDKTNWHQTNSSLLNFPSLNPGSYNLVIKCKNIQGEWSKEVMIPIRINNPYYKTNLFYSIVFLFLASFVVLAFYLYRNKLHRENKNLLLISETKQKALRAQLNPHFIFNALNSIQYLFLSKADDKALEYLNKFAVMLRNTLNNSDKLYISLDEEIQNLKMYMELEQIRKTNEFKFEILIEKEVDSYQLLVPSMLLQPIVENAIWHGLESIKQNGLIQIKVSKKDDSLLRICIIDNGVGLNTSKEREEGQKHKSKGTNLIYERISALKTTNVEASLVIFDNGNGTTAELILPFKFTV